MGTLSSILRRLRSTPKEQLMKKLSKVVDEPGLMKERASGWTRPGPRSMAEEVHTPHRLRRNSRQDPSPGSYDDDETYYRHRDRARDTRIDGENVMTLLKRLKAKGVLGIPPKKRLMSAAERRGDMMKKLMGSKAMQQITEQMKNL